jgi:hypothetical protein
MPTDRGHFEKCNACGIAIFKALQFVAMPYRFSECSVNRVSCLCLSQPPPAPNKTAHEFLCEQLFVFEINGYVTGSLILRSMVVS